MPGLVAAGCRVPCSREVAILADFEMTIVPPGGQE
jgi:hypothetical protein